MGSRVPASLWPALTLSYVLELLLAPGLACRLARIRIASREAHFRYAQGLRDDLAALRATVDAVCQMEQNVAASDLELDRSRRLAVIALQTALDSLGERARSRLDSQQLPEDESST